MLWSPSISETVSRSSLPLSSSKWRTQGETQEVRREITSSLLLQFLTLWAPIKLTHCGLFRYTSEFIPVTPEQGMDKLTEEFSSRSLDGICIGPRALHHCSAWQRLLPVLEPLTYIASSSQDLEFGAYPKIHSSSSKSLRQPGGELPKRRLFSILHLTPLWMLQSAGSRLMDELGSQGVFHSSRCSARRFYADGLGFFGEKQ